MLQQFKNYYHLVRAIWTVWHYGSPAEGIKVIGVTGTDGKTSTASLIAHILNQTGHKAALITTVGASIGEKQIDTGFHVSTPSSSQLQAYIKQIKDQGLEYLVLEVTSHAIDQNRIYGIPFEVAVLTNISREHLDYHKTMDKYMSTKVKLLQKAKTAIINKDDKSYSFVSQHLKNHPVITYGLTKADISLDNYSFNTKGLMTFQISNQLAALSVCEALHIDRRDAVKAAATFISPEGRCEVVYDKDFTVMIDFAHTPNALSAILESVSKEKKGRLIHVFGSAGKRDKGKRVLMGEVAGKFDDVIILTAEDPRNESISDICQDIQRGIPQSKEVLIKEDRQEAINTAIMLAEKGDLILLTGKGHEKSMNLGAGEQAWSEHEAVKKALQLKKQK